MQHLLGIELPIIQAPMAGVQGSALAAAVSNAGGLGSLPCAMLGFEAMRDEVAAIRAQTSRPFNVNFFCHTQPVPDPERETAWRDALSPYYREYGIDRDAIPAGPGRMPFSSEAADILEAFTPAVVSFYKKTPALSFVHQHHGAGTASLQAAGEAPGNQFLAETPCIW